jgi:hypothetical protein
MKTTQAKALLLTACCALKIYHRSDEKKATVDAVDKPAAALACTDTLIQFWKMPPPEDNAPCPAGCGATLDDAEILSCIRLVYSATDKSQPIYPVIPLMVHLLTMARRCLFSSAVQIRSLSARLVVFLWHFCWMCTGLDPHSIMM